MAKYSKRTYEVVAQCLGEVTALVRDANLTDKEVVAATQERFAAIFAQDTQAFNENLFNSMIEDIAGSPLESA